MARILCVEDDADTQQLISRALFRAGYDVHCAWNGQEGYEKTLELAPDLILLDLMLPLVNGVELLKKLKENNKTAFIPTLIVTAYGDEAQMLKEAVEILGADGYLQKPVQLSELVREIKQILARGQENAPPRHPRPKALRKGLIRADPDFMTVWIEDRLVATLPHKEFLLLRCLMANSGEVAKPALLHALGYEPSQGAALKQIAHRLRQALGAHKNRLKTTLKGYQLIG